jgi:hypothetical protein
VTNETCTSTLWVLGAGRYNLRHRRAPVTKMWEPAGRPAPMMLRLKLVPLDQILGEGLETGMDLFDR